MAERRMFTKKITDSDAFTELPPTAQALYFHLCMSADDDGFSNQTRKAIFNAQATKKDLDLLIEKKFIIFFEDRGIAVVKHWKMHNYIQKDRYNKTKYTDEMSKLTLKNNGVYSLVDKMDTDCIQNVSNMETQVRLGKDRIGKDRIDKIVIPPTLEEITDYCKERNNKINPQYFFDYYASKGWMVGKVKMTDWQATIRTWEQREKDTPKGKGAKECDDFYAMAADWVAEKKGEST